MPPLEHVPVRTVSDTGAVYIDGVLQPEGIIQVAWFYPVDDRQMAFQVAREYWGASVVDHFWPDIDKFMPGRLGDPITKEPTHVFCSIRWTQKLMDEFNEFSMVQENPQLACFETDPEEFVEQSGLVLVGESVGKTWREPHWLYNRLLREHEEVRQRRQRGEQLSGTVGIGTLKNTTVIEPDLPRPRQS